MGRLAARIRRLLVNSWVVRRFIRRPLTDWEAQLFDKLFAVEFPGRDELKQQMQEAAVIAIDADGSFGIYTECNSIAIAKSRVPIEAEGQDSDGIPIYFLLHLVDGFANELEIYKADGSEIIQVPEVCTLEVILLDA